MVGMFLSNFQNARRAACFLAITTVASLAQAPQSKPAEPAVAAANQAVLSQLPFRDWQDFEDVMRGFIATIPNTSDPYKFLQRDAPPTVNPSLWRQAQQMDCLRSLKASIGFAVSRRRT